MDHAPGARLIAQPVDLQSSTMLQLPPKTAKVRGIGIEIAL